MIPFFELKKVNYQYQSELIKAATQVIESGYYLMGEHVKSFEKNLSDYIGTENAVGVANGLDALRLIFKAYIEMGVMSLGDEIIVPANTYIASILAITDNGLIPVFVEPNLETYNLDFQNIEEKITSKTKGILVVHLYGLTCWNKKFNDLKLKYNLKIIEDNAQAIGSYYLESDDFKKTGSLGDSSAFSFYPAKNLGALGDAGAVLSNDKILINAVRALSNYGSNEKYINIFKGYNSRMDEIQAAMLNVKLKFIDNENLIRSQIAEYYLSKITNPLIILPKLNSRIENNHKLKSHVWHLFVVRCERRDLLQSYLNDNGIATVIHYPIPPHRQKAYAEFNHLKLPITELIHQQVLSLPLSPILDFKEVEYIVKIINSFK
jgi:dTDP-4-amino-4,6-dideoxygalactose transaminase